MTIDELMASDKKYLTPADVAPVLRCDPQTIRETAKKRPHLIGYNFTFTGNRMKIPRLAFLRWLGETV